MAIKTVPWLQSEVYQAVDVLLADTAVFGLPTTTLARPGGVFPGYGGNLAVTTSGLSVSVASGACLVPNSGGVGSYRVVNDGVVGLSAGVEGPTIRKDTLIMRVRDTGSEPGSYGELAILPGTAGNPAPGIPPGWHALKLAELSVSNSTATAQDFRAWAVAVGGVIPVTSTTRPADPYDGMTVYDSDSFQLSVYSSKPGTWRTVPTGATGAWTPYVPAWTTSGSGHINPTKGNSKITGRYIRNSQTVTFVINIDFVTGGSFGIGKGVYELSLPAGLPAFDSGVAGAQDRQLVTAHYYRPLGEGSPAIESSKQWAGNGLIRGGGTTVSEIRFAPCFNNSAYKGGIWAENAPFVKPPAAINGPVSGDNVTISGSYETGAA